MPPLRPASATVMPPFLLSSIASPPVGRFLPPPSRSARRGLRLQPLLALFDQLADLLPALLADLLVEARPVLVADRLAALLAALLPALPALLLVDRLPPLVALPLAALAPP